MNEMVKIQHQQWARDLNDQRRSGLTQREWCRIHGISNHTFEYRCRIIRKTMENLLSEKQPSVQFAELAVQPSVPETSAIRIQASGFSVEVFPNADCNQLKTVMEVGGADKKLHTCKALKSVKNVF